ncbi:hypothetical protein niasHT_032367 [Heterodera trifolii]|uniref:Uncharacterized protein n=1 Tax=Heterodera trifolii TaxID=157864 RepID=A0ABD2HYH4_9BILA
MRFWYLLNISDHHTQFLSCFRVSNRTLCFLFGLAQFLVVLASLFQHVYSWTKFGHVFKCKSNISADATTEQRLLAYDLVIFDFGLMHRILKMSKCVANYLDGGYLRFSWCVEHSLALLVLLIVLILSLKRIWLYWPALFMQSTYVLGMAILTMATTPKMLEALSRSVDNALGIAFCIYIGGVLLNWMFTLVLWHHYWAEEANLAQNIRENETAEGEGEGRNVMNQRKRGMEVWMSNSRT